MGKLVHGIGINDGKYPARCGDRMMKEYEVWRQMLNRCTENLWVVRPSYVGTTCSENFKSYTFFYEWCQEQVGFKNVDNGGNSWHLDKDILVRGNKVYSEDACVFVPLRLNNLLTRRGASRGDTPIGVSWNNKRDKFTAQCNDGEGNLKHLGAYHTTKEAFQAYKSFKEHLIKEVANEYKERLDARAYQALINYEVNITD